MRDLGLTLAGSWVEPLVGQVLDELAARGLRLKPHFWLSDEWFSPAGVPGVAIPFYLVSPRLMRLERSRMLEVEGGTREECLRLLRHEVGHAIQHAWALHRRRDWQRAFGSSSKRYPESYRPNPASRRYVQHLDAWYAQSHPDEDFAETFAVWLTPKSRWRKRYDGWPAVAKLDYVDRLMREIRRAPLVARSRQRVDPVSRLGKTLREHYVAKRERYAVGGSSRWDDDLRRIFSSARRPNGRESAVRFLRRHRAEIRELVSRWTGEYVFTIDQVLKQMLARCRAMKLRAAGGERQLKLDFCIMLTARATHYLYRRREWHVV
jgi:hypothetical protein